MEEQRDDPRRRRTKKGFLRRHPSERVREIGHIQFGRLGIAHADRTIAAGSAAPCAAGVAKHPPGEFRKADEVLIDERPALAPEAVQPVFGVGGIARLAHLAIIDDVDAGLDLLFDDGRHRRADAGPQSRRIDRHTLLFGEHRAHEVLRPRQAAGMGRQEAFGAALHRR